MGAEDAVQDTGAPKGWMDGAVQWQEGGARQGGWESGDPAPSSPVMVAGEVSTTDPEP